MAELRRFEPGDIILDKTTCNIGVYFGHYFKGVAPWDSGRITVLRKPDKYDSVITDVLRISDVKIIGNTFEILPKPGDLVVASDNGFLYKILSTDVEYLYNSYRADGTRAPFPVTKPIYTLYSLYNQEYNMERTCERSEFCLLVSELYGKHEQKPTKKINILKLLFKKVNI